MGSWSGIVALPAGHVVVGADTLPLTQLAAVTAETYFVRKPTDQTVNNSTTLVNDSDLIQPIVASATYQFECYIVHNSNSTADWKALWSLPAGATMFYTSIGFGVGGTFSMFHNTEGTTQSSEGAGADRPYLMRGLLLVSSTPGNMQLTWAQNTANASNTIVRAGSYLHLTRVL